MQEGKTGVVERMKADGLAAMVEALRLYGEIDQMKRGLERILARYVMRGEPSVLSVGDLSVEAAGKRSVETRRGRAVNFFIDGDMVQTIILNGYCWTGGDGGGRYKPPTLAGRFRLTASLIIQRLLQTG